MFGITSNGRTIRPDTDVIEPSHAELVKRVNVLAAEIARLNRVIAEIPTGAIRVSTTGPVPLSADAADSPRALYRMIAVALGKNEDTVRQSIARGAAFAPLREREPNLAQNMPLLRWIATGDHYARIMRGDSIKDVVAGR